MSVKKLIEGKGAFVSVVPSHVTVDDVINQLEVDDVSALVVSDDGKNILGVMLALTSSEVSNPSAAMLATSLSMS